MRDYKVGDHQRAVQNKIIELRRRIDHLRHVILNLQHEVAENYSEIEDIENNIKMLE
jgi:peptidoglycan hydrolase CwlO-like protein